MLRPLLIAVLETKRLLKDRGDLAFSLVLPIALFAIMYGVFGGSGAGFNGTANVVNLDGGPSSQELLARLRSVDGLTVKVVTLDQAKSDLDHSRILTAVVIPQDFSSNLREGKAPSITFMRRGNGGDEGQIVSAIVQGIAQNLAAEAQVHQVVGQAMAGSGLPQSQIDQVVHAQLQQSRQDPPVTVATQTVGEASQGTSLDQLLPGIVTMFLLFSLTLASQNLVEERRIGTLERLMTTRLSVNQLFLGKFLAGVVRAFLQALVLLALAFVVLRIAGVATFAEVVAFSALIAAAVSAIGLLLGAIARSRDQATWMAVFVTMFMTVFGGTFFNIGSSGVLQFVSRLTINKYAIDALRGMLAGTSGLGDHSLEMAVMVGVTIGGLVLARLAFRVVEGGR